MANKKIAGITVEIGGDTTNLSKALQDSDKKARELKTELKEVDKALKLDPSNVVLLKQKQDILAESIKNSKEKLDTLKSAQEQVTAQYQRGEIDDGKFRAFQREIETAEQDLKNAQTAADELKSTGKTAANEVGEAFENAGDKISQAGDKIASAGEKLLPVTAAVTAIGGYGIKSASEFEDSMAKLSTIADTTKVPLETLEKDIKSLSDSTGIGASEIAENVYNAISAGQDTADAVNFVAESTKLATAGFADSGAALDVLTTILNAYGMKAEDVTHVSDVLINTQNLGKTTVGELASSMGKVIPTANASGVSLENLAASYAIMTSNGIATAESTTYLNSLLNELSKSGTKSSETIKKETGKSFQELTAEGKSLADILSIVQKSADKNGLSMNDLFGSAEAGKAAMTLLSGGVDDYNAKLESMEKASGSTDEAFEKLQTNSRKARIAINQLKNSAIELGTTILQMLQPYIEKVTEKIREFTKTFNNLDDSTKKTIIKIAGVAAAIGPVLILIGKLTSGVGGLISSVGSLFNLAAANPWVLAIGAVVAALAILYVKNEEFRNFVNDMAKEFVQFFEDMTKEIKKWYTDNKPVIDQMITVLQFLKKVIGEFLMKTIQDLWQAFKTAWTIISNTWQVATSFFSTIWENIKQIFSVVESVLTGDFSGAWEGIKKIFTNTGEFFGGVWDSIKNVFSGIGTWFSEKFSNAWDYAKKAFELEKVGKTFGDVKDKIVGAFKSIPEAIEEIFNDALDKAKSIAGKIGDEAEKITDKIPGVSTAKKAAGKIKSKIPFLAGGGVLSKNGDVAVVGEAGPELLQLLNGKAVVTPFGGGGSQPKPTVAENAQTAPNRTVVHQTYNIYVKEFASPQDARTTSQELARLQRQTDFGKGVIPV